MKGPGERTDERLEDHVRGPEDPGPALRVADVLEQLGLDDRHFKDNEPFATELEEGVPRISAISLQFL